MRAYRGKKDDGSWPPGEERVKIGSVTAATLLAAYFYGAAEIVTVVPAIRIELRGIHKAALGERWLIISNSLASTLEHFF